MNRKFSLSMIASAALLSLSSSSGLQAQQNPMTFFVTSIGLGQGGNLGGLLGADQHCQRLAQTVGAPPQRTWRAYLSTVNIGSAAVGVNARDRIGLGPWQNAQGVVIARNLDELHGDNNLTKQTALNEKGQVINGVGDNPNMHDMLTGSTMAGRAYPIGSDLTCRNWTSSGPGAAQVGHSDRRGLTDTVEARSWNSSHASRGCSQENLRSTGSAGLFYCFAIN